MKTGIVWQKPEKPSRAWIPDGGGRRSAEDPFARGGVPRRTEHRAVRVRTPSEQQAASEALSYIRKQLKGDLEGERQAALNRGVKVSSVEDGVSREEYDAQKRKEEEENKADAHASWIESLKRAGL